MNLRNFFDHYILNLAILWNFADFYMGDKIVTFLALPLVLFGRLIHYFSIDLFYILFMLNFTLVLFVTFIGLRVLPIERFTKLLLPKILGFMVSLFWVKSRLINLFLLGVLYNFIYSIVFKYFVAKDSINAYFKDALGLTFFWEKYLLLFTTAISSGFLTSMCYHLLKLFSFVF